jgi:hypothetical protein
MKNVLVYSALTLTCISCFATFSTSQTKRNNEEVIVALGKGRAYPQKEIQVSLEGGFSDSLAIYLNDHLVAQKLFLTNENLGLVEDGTLLLALNASGENRFRIVDLSGKKKTLDVILVQGYRTLYLNHYSSWGLFYSNGNNPAPENAPVAYRQR